MSCSGEGHFHTKVVAPFVEMMREYNRWQAAVDDVVYRGRSSYDPISRAEMMDVIRVHIRWLMMRRGVAPEVIWVGDKTPVYTECLPDLRALFPEARYVHVVRDPRDVTVSRLFQRARTGADPNFAMPDHPVHHQTVEAVARSWKNGAELVKSFAASFPGILHEVRYGAHLLWDSRATAGSLFRFFDLDPSADTLAEIERQTRFETMTGGRARGTADAASFYRKGIAGYWLEHLDQAAVSTIETHCGALMDAYGYPRREAATGQPDDCA